MNNINASSILLEKKRRRCLVCNRQFLSAGPHNRRCNKCRIRLHNVYQSVIYKVHDWE